MWKILKRIEIVLAILLAFFLLVFIICHHVFPAFGIHFNVGSSGDSMDPTIIDGALTIWRDDIPFSELQVGDIIIYQERVDAHGGKWASASGNIHLYKEGEEPEEPPEPEKPTYRDEGIEYVDDKQVLHRIVEIRQDDEYLDRALFTRGDNNRGLDPQPTFESGYVGKVTWTMNYIGWPFRIMYTYRGLFWLYVATLVLGVVLGGHALFTSATTSCVDDKSSTDSEGKVS